LKKQEILAVYQKGPEAICDFVHQLENQIQNLKGIYKGRPTIYSPKAKDPQKRLVYNRVVEMLNNGAAISHIAKENGITRQTVYRIKQGMLG